MDRVVRCTTCGAVMAAAACRSCGAELLTDEMMSVLQRAASEHGRSERDRAEWWSDHDQTTSDQDQTWSDHDQTASESDQRSADDDQDAADHDLAAGGDRVTYQRSALARQRSSRDRAAVSARRDESAAERLRTAEERDRAAVLRDRGAQGRDELARLHDLDDDEDATREDILARSRRDRARAAADRAKAADDRLRAASDREHAARERDDAARHRAASADELRFATTDELTGAWTRKYGLEEVSRELDRAHRTGTPLVLAFVDVDDLKGVNDNQGHLAGDRLLQRVGETLRANVRPYDVIVRYGGDELVCAMPNLNAAEARERFTSIVAALTAVDPSHSVTFGLAEAEPTDSMRKLIARADADLLEARRPGHSSS
jgi:diguanylate cyclase (GGDEF)-like protein